ncbi:MAG: hypothetical protein Q7R70_06180 [Candidatus Diapherotrites archaeon]|nr:hypothetical protein [Candidatus Diapherotrites archaeon]
MTELSLILLASAVILFLVVWLIDLSKPKRVFQEPSNPEVKVYFNKELASESRLPADYSTAETMIAIQSRLNAMSKKTDMAHSRLNDLEQELVASKSESAGVEETKLLPFEKRLEKFDNFRSDTENEIKALKEIIAAQLAIGRNPRTTSYDSLRKQDEEFLSSQIFKARTPRGRTAKR